MRRLLALLLVPACLMCSGCNEVADESEQETDTTPASPSEESVANCADYDGQMTIGECELRLHDGRRVTCAVLISYRRGGLSCDWEHATKTTEKTE